MAAVYCDPDFDKEGRERLTHAVVQIA